MSAIATLAASAVFGASVASGTGAVPPQPIPDAGATSAPFTAPQGEAADWGWLVMPFSKDQLDKAKGGETATTESTTTETEKTPEANPAAESAKASQSVGDKGDEAPAAPAAPVAPPKVETPKLETPTVAPVAEKAPEAEKPAASGQWWQVLFGGFGNTSTDTNTDTPDEPKKDGGFFAWVWTPSAWFGGGDKTETENTDETETAKTETVAEKGDAAPPKPAETGTPAVNLLGNN